MKFFTALGGFLGFAIVLGIGFATGRHSVMLLFQASIAMVVGAMLFRWWHRMLLEGVKASIEERRAAAAAAKRAEAAAASSSRSGAQATR